jgi:hypothetical protein
MIRRHLVKTTRALLGGDVGSVGCPGVVVGTIRGGAQQSQANAESKRQAAETGRSAEKAEEEMLRNHQAGIDTFQRAFAACMDARNYSVK